MNPAFGCSSTSTIRKSPLRISESAIDSGSRTAGGRLTMPMRAIEGEKSFGTAIAAVMRAAATDVTEGVIPASGHRVMEENPTAAITMIRAFLDKGGRSTPFSLSASGGMNRCGDAARTEPGTNRHRSRRRRRLRPRIGASPRSPRIRHAASNAHGPRKSSRSVHGSLRGRGSRSQPAAAAARKRLTKSSSVARSVSDMAQ